MKKPPKQTAEQRLTLLRKLSQIDKALHAIINDVGAVLGARTVDKLLKAHYILDTVLLRLEDAPLAPGERGISNILSETGERFR